MQLYERMFSLIAIILLLSLRNVYSHYSGHLSSFTFQIVGSHVHFFLADWRKEEFEAGESMRIQEGPCSLSGGLRER